MSCPQFVGSIALDTVKTPVEEHADLLGGSASYAALGASFFSPVNLVGVVGDDFPESGIRVLEIAPDRRTGVQRVERENVSLVGRIRLGPEHARDTFGRAECFRNILARTCRQIIAHTISFCWPTSRPHLQSHVLDQMERPRFVVADTMDLWIETTRAGSRRFAAASRSADSERQRSARDDQGNESDQAGRKIRGYGPRYVAIKKGEHGALLFGEDDFFSCGAYPLEDIHDPTGAGDTFAGGFAGYLAAHVQENVTFDVTAQGDDLWKCAGEFLCGSVQSRALARIDPGRNY